MLKACSTCGKIHKANETCPQKEKKKHGKRKNLTDFDQKYIKFISSIEWQKAREATKTRFFYLCPICSVQGRYDGKRKYDAQRLEVHHIIPVRENWNLRLKKTNLICLCFWHHKLAENGVISRSELLRYTKESPPGQKF